MEEVYKWQNIFSGMKISTCIYWISGWFDIGATNKISKHILFPRNLYIY